MASFLVFLPAILLSGFMFPVTSMPEIFQWATLLNPVRHYIEFVRAVFLRGAGLEALSRPFAALFLIGATVLLFLPPKGSESSQNERQGFEIRPFSGARTRNLAARPARVHRAP
jgi:ABC-type multidrug transport system permease subunit